MFLSGKMFIHLCKRSIYMAQIRKRKKKARNMLKDVDYDD